MSYSGTCAHADRHMVNIDVARDQLLFLVRRTSFILIRRYATVPFYDPLSILQCQRLSYEMQLSV